MNCGTLTNYISEGRQNQLKMRKPLASDTCSFSSGVAARVAFSGENDLINRRKTIFNFITNYVSQGKYVMGDLMRYNNKEYHIV